MDNHEEYIDAYLNEFLVDQNNAEKLRQEYAQTVCLRRLDAFDPGDRVSMTLAGLAFTGTFTQRLFRVEATLVDPVMSLIDVKLADDLDEWEGKTIGLGVYAELPKKGEFRMHPKAIAGTCDVAYYLPEDIEMDDLGRPHIDKEKLRLLGLTYLRVVVGGSVIIEPPRL